MLLLIGVVVVVVEVLCTSCLTLPWTGKTKDEIEKEKQK